MRSVFPVPLPAAPSPSVSDTLGIPRVARVLLVDEEETARYALARLLRERGYGVHICESVGAALTLLEQEAFAVMLCGDRMPEMPGLELVQRALGLDRDLAVLMLSGVNDARAAMSALSRGALDYLV